MSRRSARTSRAPTRLELDVSDTALQQVHTPLQLRPQAAERPKNQAPVIDLPLTLLQLGRSQPKAVAMARNLLLWCCTCCF